MAIDENVVDRQTIHTAEVCVCVCCVCGVCCVCVVLECVYTVYVHSRVCVHMCV